MLPMNESLVYYSKKPFLNQVAINPVWHLAYDVRAAGLTDENPFLTMPEAEAEKIVHQLYASNKDSFPEILSNRLPNIVVLILESHTADVVASLGGESGISPVLEQLMSEGVSFSNIYSACFLSLIESAGRRGGLSGSPWWPSGGIFLFTVLELCFEISMESEDQEEIP